MANVFAQGNQLFQFLKKFSGQYVGEAGRSANFANVLEPDGPFYAVGDIHGRLDLLVDLMAKINPDEDQQIVFLGDYVDRGPESAKTLIYLYEFALRCPKNVVCLMGNHERMMLDFIDDPLGRGAGWLQNGAKATLASFGIPKVSQSPSADELLEVSSALEAALARDLLAWLRGLPLCWNSGNLWCVHGAMDPAEPPKGQRSNTMLWGNSDFLELPRKDGACVIHGHTTVMEPTNWGSRIAVDTGAYRTGRLTGAFITEGKCDFVST